MQYVGFNARVRQDRGHGLSLGFSEIIFPYTMEFDKSLVRFLVALFVGFVLF